MSIMISFALRQGGGPSAIVSFAMPLGACFHLFSLWKTEPSSLRFSLPSSLPTRRPQCNSILDVVDLPSRKV